MFSCSSDLCQGLLQGLTESPISLGHHKMAAVDPDLQLTQTLSFYHSFCEHTVNLSKQAI